MPLFSLITITYNNRQGLAATAKTIAEQTCHDVEWIIIDGASTDGTRDDFQRYTTANITCEEDGGIYDAMNKGIDKANGDYILFLNAGDLFASPDTLSNISSRLGHQRPGFIYGDSLENGNLKKARPTNTLLYGMITHHQSMLYHRKTLGHMRYNTDYRIAADYDLTLRFLRKTDNILYIQQPISIFEQGGISQRQTSIGRREQFRARQRNKSCNVAVNSAIYGTQLLTCALKQHAEGLYWLLRRIMR